MTRKIAFEQFVEAFKKRPDRLTSLHLTQHYNKRKFVQEKYFVKGEAII